MSKTVRVITRWPFTTNKQHHLPSRCEYDYFAMSALLKSLATYCIRAFDI